MGIQLIVAMLYLSTVPAVAYHTVHETDDVFTLAIVWTTLYSLRIDK